MACRPTRRWNQIHLLIGVVFLGLLTGCQGFNRAPHSYDREGERVLVRMLTLSELKELHGQLDDGAKGDYEKSFAAATKDMVEAEASEAIGTTEFLESAAAFASGIVGVAIDLIAKELEKDAERYQMQYRGIHYNDRFWKEGKKQAFHGFEVVRWTSTWPEAKGHPASRFVCAIVPSRFDPTIFVLRPVFIEVNGAKAKIPDIGKDTFTVEFDIQLIAAIAKSGSLKEAILATTKWKVGGLDLDDGLKNYRTFHDESGNYREEFTAGWFLGVPLPEGKDQGGAFKLAVAVTETADTKAPEYLEQAAGYLRENKETIQNRVKGFIEPTE